MRGLAVSRTLSLPPLVAAARAGRTDPAWLTRGCEIVLDLAVVALSTWTVAYHVCLLLQLGVPWAVSLQVLALVGWGFLARRASPGPGGCRWGPQPRTPTARTPAAQAAPAESSHTEPLLIAAAVVSGAAAAFLLAVNASWPAVAGLWLTSAVAGTVWAGLRLRRAPSIEKAGQEGDPDPESQQPTGTLVAIAWATALAVLSVFTLRPNPDDLYYVNLSQWVVEHGTFPVRDTIFSDLVFPMASWPPVASYDAMVGTLGRLAGLPAASVVYLLVPPAATFLSVLAIWRLLRAWRVKAVGVALSLALVFLLFDGGPGYAAPGALFLTRLWQGKVILLCILVPILLVYALRYVERPTWDRAGWLFAGGVAAVGLSTSAMFVVPLIALAGAAPLCVRRPKEGLLGFFAMAAYPLAAGTVTVAVGGHSADLFDDRKLYRFDPEWFGHEIFRDGALGAIGVAAVLAGALLVPHQAARVTTGALAVITGLTFVPGVTNLSYDLVGLGPTLWRVSWVASVAALVGVMGAHRATYRPGWVGRLTGPLALVLVLVVSGVPIWAERSGVTFESGPHWQRGRESVASAQLAIDAARPGDVILAPDQLAITIDVLTTRVKTVAPRAYFMDYMRDEPDFHYPERLTLVDFANQATGSGHEREVARALTLLDVDEVCLPVEFRRQIRFLLGQGYRSAASSAYDHCLTR